MAGIVTPFLEKTNRVTNVSVMVLDRTLAHMKFAPHESPYSFVAMVPQDVTEGLLVEARRCTGGSIGSMPRLNTEANQPGSELQSWLGAMGRTALYAIN